MAEKVESACNEGDLGSIRVRKIPWRRKWQPTAVFLLENAMDGGAWWATVHGIAKNWTQLRDYTFTFHLQQPSIILGVGGYRDKQNKVHTLTELIFYLGSQRILVSNK